MSPRSGNNCGTVGTRYPSRIVCLTEETTETLYLLGEGDRIVGISGYTVRPPEARAEAEGIGVHQRALRQDRGAAARSHPGVLRPAGGHRRRAHPARPCGRDVQPAQHRRDPPDDPDGGRARRLRRPRRGARRFARARPRRCAREGSGVRPAPAGVLRRVGQPAHLGNLLGGRAGGDRRWQPAVPGIAEGKPGEEPDRRRRTKSRHGTPRSSSRRGAGKR